VEFKETLDKLKDTCGSLVLASWASSFITPFVRKLLGGEEFMRYFAPISYDLTTLYVDLVLNKPDVINVHKYSNIFNRKVAFQLLTIGQTDNKAYDDLRLYDKIKSYYYVGSSKGVTMRLVVFIMVIVGIVLLFTTFIGGIVVLLLANVVSIWANANEQRTFED
jgi:uncharacterized membrane protein